MHLIYDDDLHAIRAAIEDAKGYKKTAEFLWPSMQPASAYSRLKACTSSSGDQRLKWGEVIALCNFNERFDPLYFACDETGHNRPTQKSPIDEEARIASVMEGAAATLESAMRALDRMRSRQTGRVSSVKS